LSPDGQEIAFVRAPLSRAKPSTGEYEVFVARSDGTHQRRVTKGWTDDAPTWSPDGQTLVFDRQSHEAAANENSFQDQLYLVGRDGTGLRRLTAAARGILGRPAWAPDGGSIAFSGTAARGFGLYVARSDGRGLRLVAGGF